MYCLKTECSFDAAHFLTDYHGKCENLHGHRWRVVSTLAKEALETQGTQKDMVVDFGLFKEALASLTDRFDHMFIVEAGSLQDTTVEALQTEGFRLVSVPFRTTAENFARYFYDELCKLDFPVGCVEVYESPHNCASYSG